MAGAVKSLRATGRCVTGRTISDAAGHSGASNGLPQRRDDLFVARLPGRPPHDPPVGVEHQHGGRLENVEPAYEVQVLLGVDLDVGDAGDDAGHLSENT